MTEETHHPDLLGEPARWPTTLGVISLIYGIGGLLCASGYVGSTFFSEALMKLSGIEVTMPMSLKLQAAAFGVAAFVLGIIMIIGATALLRRRPSGVSLLKFWAVARLTVLVVGLVAGVLTAPAQIQMQRQIIEGRNEIFRQNDMESRVKEPDDREIWQKLMLQVSIMTAIFALYPAFLGVHLSRRKVAEEVEQWER